MDLASKLDQAAAVRKAERDAEAAERQRIHRNARAVVLRQQVGVLTDLLEHDGPADIAGFTASCTVRRATLPYDQAADENLTDYLATEVSDGLVIGVHLNPKSGPDIYRTFILTECTAKCQLTIATLVPDVHHIEGWADARLTEHHGDVAACMDRFF